MNRRDMIKALPAGLLAGFTTKSFSSSAQPLAGKVNNNQLDSEFLDFAFRELDKQIRPDLLKSKYTTIFEEANNNPCNRFDFWIGCDSGGYKAKKCPTAKIKYFLDSREEDNIIETFGKKYNLRIDKLPRVDAYFDFKNRSKEDLLELYKDCLSSIKQHYPSRKKMVLAIIEDHRVLEKIDFKEEYLINKRWDIIGRALQILDATPKQLENIYITLA